MCVLYNARVTPTFFSFSSGFVNISTIQKHFIGYLQACKAEELGLVDYEEAIKERNQTVYLPNWFSVDIKTGVSHGYLRLRVNGHNNIQQCWELLANNVASVCTGLKV